MSPVYQDVHKEALHKILANGTSVPETAAALIEAELFPIPIPKREKGPSHIKEWEQKEFTAADFRPDGNIGLHNTNIVAVDRDCEESYMLRDRFLPKTFRTGRESKPESHSWYLVEGVPPFLQLKDGSMMVELRYGQGKQTVIPPSIHPSGESYIVGTDHPVTTISAEELERGVRLEGAACLIARHYEKSGGRHTWGLALAGYLLRHGVSENEAIELMLAARELQPEPMSTETEKSIQGVIKSTAEGLARGDKNIAGGGVLADEGHKDLVAKLPKILGWDDKREEDPKAQAERAWPVCAELAESEDILGEIYAMQQQDGLVGEERNAKTMQLVAGTKHMGRPMSAIIDGESSGGKSYLLKELAKTLPEDAIYTLQSISDRALAYIGENTLSNKFLLVYELGGLGKEGESGIEMVKQLLTEGRIDRQIAESTGKGVRGRRVYAEGPTGLWTTTTKSVVDGELQNRALTLTIDESPEQTEAIIKARKQRRKRKPVDFSPVKALHTWLAAQGGDVDVPFEDVIADGVDTKAVRMRRFYAYVMELVESHALLHRATRCTDEDGYVIARLQDYEAVYALVKDIVSVAAEVSVLATLRQTVEAAENVIAGPKSLTSKTLAEELEISRSSATRRIKKAVAEGYLKPDPEAEGKAKVYVLGDIKLPEEAASALPAPAEVAGKYDQVCNCAVCARGGPPGGKNGEAKCAQTCAQGETCEECVGSQNENADTYAESDDPLTTHNTDSGHPVHSVHTCTLDENGAKCADEKRGVHTSVHTSESANGNGHDEDETVTPEPRVFNTTHKEPFDVYVGRGGGRTRREPSKWGNPFLVDTDKQKKDGTPQEVCLKFLDHLDGPVENYKGEVFDGSHLCEELGELTGKTLGCHCAPKGGLTADDHPYRCHGQVLLYLANAEKDDEEQPHPNGNPNGSTPETADDPTSIIEGEL